ncbi:FAD-dependent oxidoreductase FixC [Telmatospirillum sp.]|uniref:FAD-dependent oxidoreductase FixC n=1 Tax=Telmatospirillum sp. TaxID=2079197 RepID=UPI00285127DD|nr:FAD-dependent oxidoreductase FixC [Telmatospirillum sp.]MDR3439330.1 FAD-dependent oxidoreductase FixC [Telmatospirillum sp.]
MSEEDSFDALIVGAGIAGCVAGYLLAKEGLQVLVIERGNYAGTKNMTGGRLYTHSLEKVMPGFADQAPVERRVTHEKISFLTDDSAMTVDFQTGRASGPGETSYTVLRASFDKWLMEQAEAAGVQLVPGVRVDELLVKDGKVTGVKAGDEELEAKVVILADGVNSILAEKLGLTKRVAPHNVAVGAKELIELPQDVLEARFNLEGNEGLAWMFAGTPSAGRMGGGFIYTNKNTLSLGVVVGLEGIGDSPKSVPQMLEDFKEHPVVKPLIKDGKLIEYSGHVVPEGGLNMLPKLAADGVMIVGDAAGLCLNVGYTVRGMDLAVASAEAAALTVLEARKSGNYSEAGLAGYRRRLEESFVLKDLSLYKRLPAFLEGNPRMFTAYPKLMVGVMEDLFTIDGTPSLPLMKKMRKRIGDIGFMNLIKDGLAGVRSL